MPKIICLPKRTIGGYTKNKRSMRKGGTGNLNKGNAVMWVIDDDSMYRYFEELITDSKNKLKEWRCEAGPMPYGLTDYDVKAMYGSKRLLYGEHDAGEQMCLLENMQRFLHEYVGIDGLEELLVNNYGTIENSIFFEHNDQGQPASIREHSKHQMKNAYLGSVLLLECGYLKDMAETVAQGRSAATRYLCYQAEAALGLKNGGAGGKKLLDKLEEWCYKIYMVSALLHDIGYPLEYYLRSAKKLTDYPPYLKLLSPTVKLPYGEMKALLSESQLFHIVEQEKIKEKYEKDNHGVLSAISLLLHFYYGGRIYAMSAEKRCIIEMAALAVYHHTDRFEGGKRMVYMQDPISFMVRLCDDLQEWDRFKITINEKHNYLRCPRCGRLLLEKDLPGVYQCDCAQRSQFQKVTEIRNKKMNYICLCDRLRLEKKEDRLLVLFDFSLLRQIEILTEEYTAVLKQEKAIKDVEEMLEDQHMVPRIKLMRFLSNNPLCLIEEMIRRTGWGQEESEEKIWEWIRKQKNEKLRKNLQEFFEDYKEKKTAKVFGKKLENNSLRYKEEVCEYVKNHYGEIHYLEEDLLRKACQNS